MSNHYDICLGMFLGWISPHLFQFAGLLVEKTRCSNGKFWRCSVLSPRHPNTWNGVSPLHHEHGKQIYGVSTCFQHVSSFFQTNVWNLKDFASVCAPFLTDIFWQGFPVYPQSFFPAGTTWLPAFSSSWWTAMQSLR